MKPIIQSLFGLFCLLTVVPSWACSTHGTNIGNGFTMEYGAQDNDGNVVVRLALESTLVTPGSATTCVAGLGLGSTASPLPAGVMVTGVSIEIRNSATQAVATITSFDFSPDPETTDGMARGSQDPSPDAPNPLVEGATWFGFSSDVGPFDLTLGENEATYMVFDLKIPAAGLPLMTDAQIGAGEGQPDGTPIFTGDHPISYFTGIGTGLVFSLFEINAGLNDAWVFEDADFQGFFFTIFPSLEFFFLSWFTFDSVIPAENTATFGASDQRWVTASGQFSGNWVILDAELTTGGVFNADDPLAEQFQGYGVIALYFVDCTQVLVIYNFPGVGLSGQMILERVLPDNTQLCIDLGTGPT